MVIPSSKDETQPSQTLTESQKRLAGVLIREGLLDGPDDRIRFVPMSGGVSSDIHLITDGAHKIVMKQALSKLRVKDDWYADVKRNHFEHEYIRYVSSLDPGIVPRVLYSNDEEGFFTMEYLSEGFSTWKEMLLDKKISGLHAKTTGKILGEIHRTSWNNESLLRKFDTTDQFVQLRVDPYLYTTGKRTPGFRDLFEEEGQRLIRNRKCLVHGDYSPKNLLVGENRMVIIDCEVAWYGDPSFDVCFLLNHLFLKALYYHELAGDYLELARSAWDSYADAMGREYAADIERDVGRLLLMLMIARVDGKSPAEYLTEERKRRLIRDFVKSGLTKDYSVEPVRNISSAWLDAIRNANT